jgi:hypothetical protein
MCSAEGTLADPVVFAAAVVAAVVDVFADAADEAASSPLVVVEFVAAATFLASSAAAAAAAAEALRSSFSLAFTAASNLANASREASMAPLPEVSSFVSWRDGNEWFHLNNEKQKFHADANNKHAQKRRSKNCFVKIEKLTSRFRFRSNTQSRQPRWQHIRARSSMSSSLATVLVDKSREDDSVCTLAAAKYGLQMTAELNILVTGNVAAVGVVADDLVNGDRSWLVAESSCWRKTRAPRRCMALNSSISREKGKSKMR